MAKDLRGDQHKAKALTAYILDGTPPSADAMAATKRAGRPAGEQLQNLWAMDNVLSLIAAKPGDRQRYINLLLAFLALAERTHWSQWESGGYRRYQFLAWRAALLWATLESGFGDLRAAARGYLRNLLALGALQANGHGHVIAVAGRIQVRPSTDWTTAGDTEVDQTCRTRALLGFDGDRWWPPKGIGPAYLRDHGRWIDALPGLVRPLFTDAERSALRAWVREWFAGPELARLIAPICLPQRLHVLRSSRGHVAWAEDVRSEGTRTCQPLVYSVKREGTPPDAEVAKKSDHYESRFVIVKPPAGAERVGTDWWWRVTGGGWAGQFSPEVIARRGDTIAEIVIDLSGGRIVGEAPVVIVPPAEPKPPGEPVPPPPSSDDPRLNAEGRVLLSDLRRIKHRLTVAEVHAHWIDPPGASSQRVLMGEAILEMLG